MVPFCRTGIGGEEDNFRPVLRSPELCAALQNIRTFYDTVVDTSKYSTNNLIN